jgi:predicted RNA-binding protein with TRAM domain
VASIEGVRVLNVNELAHALRPVALPGDSFEVKVLQVGSNREQGVGYLEDGTMIVIDNARKDIGKKVRVHVTRTHQTVAGKMLFAQRVDTVADRQPYRDNALKDNYRKTSNQHQRADSRYKQPIGNTRITPAERSLLKTIEDSHQSSQ